MNSGQGSKGAAKLSLDRLLAPLVRISYVAAIVVFVASLYLTFEGQIWVVQLGSVSSISVGSVCILYLLGDYRFKTAGVSATNSFVLAILLSNAFLQSYEVIYNATFGVPFTGTEARMLILWLIMISPLFLMRQYLRFRRTTALLFLSVVAVWAVWILYGFPQYYLQGYFFTRYLTTSDPYHLSLWLNFGSKALLAAFFASMLDPLTALKSGIAFVRRGPPSVKE